MTQFDYGTINPSTKSGTTLASDLNSFRNALNTSHAGTSQPSYVQTGMVWADNTAANLIFKVYDGTDDVPVYVVDASNNVVRVALDNDRDTYIVSDVDDEIKMVVVSATIFTVVGTGLRIASGKSLLDSNSNELIEFIHTASAVNNLEIANAATGTGPELRATGSDTNINVEIIPKGTGGVALPDGSAANPILRFLNSAALGIYYIASNVMGFAANGAEVMRVLDKAVFFAKQVLCDVETITYGAAFNVDLTTQSVKEFTTSATAATATITNKAANQSVECWIKCNSASASLAWSGVTYWKGGAAPTVSTTVGEWDLVILKVMDDGTTVQGIYGGRFS